MRRRGLGLVLLWLGLQSGALAAPHRPELENLRCDAQVNPMAIADSRPVFTWIYGTGATAGDVESAARIVVLSGAAPLWDSGWVTEDDLRLRYDGPPLEPGHAYQWHVETRLRNGGIVRSRTTEFHTAFGAWQAQWIMAPWSTERDGAEADGSRPMPIFRHQFVLRAKPVDALLRVVGLGQWQVRIGYGNQVHLAQPRGLHGAWTDYRKTVEYDTVDVTKLLGKGPAVFAVLLGNGMYNVQRTPLPGQPRGRYTKFAESCGPPKVIAELHVRYADGSTQVIATDQSWRVARGPVVFDSAYGGEDFDARQEPAGWDRPKFDDAGWAHAEVVSGPGGELIPTIAPSVGEHTVYRPVWQKDIRGRIVYDLGQNFAGVARINVKGPAGAVLRLIPGELLNEDGSVSQATFHGPAWWSYTLRGNSVDEVWQPLFGYGGFRYVQAEWTPGPGTAAALRKDVPPEGTILSLEGVEEHSNSQDAGSFESSVTMLNQIHSLILHAMHNNEMSLLTDSPEREKLGWLEQTHLVAAGLILNNDVERLYQETDRNIADAQLPDGIVPTIAPQYTKFGPKNAIFDDSPEWGSASVLAPMWAYRFYDNPAELERMYPVMKRYVAALESKAQDGIVAYGLGDWYDIGPGGPGFEKNTSLGVTATMMLLEDAQAMQKIAAVLGHLNDAAQYEQLAQRTIAAFNRKFWDAKKGWYDRGSQTAQAMPLALGAVPEDRRAQVLSHLLSDIHGHEDHVTAGEVGYPYLLRALEQSGHDGLILEMLLRRDPPSYGSQLEAGATSLTEAWDANPHNSQDHFMLGSADSWFYRRLGGIDIDMSRSDTAARVTVRPTALPGIDWVKTSYDACIGSIQSSWTWDGSMVRYSVRIPGGVESTVVLPASAVAVDARVHQSQSQAGDAVFRVGPGSWEFIVRP